MNKISVELERLRKNVDSRLAKLLDIFCEPGILKDAMSYSLLAGGKRLRPSLCLMSAGMFGNEKAALDIACAIEMIHTYSLIHDDLPAMDDDKLRRGKPTNHVVFGEAYAILAGDGLLNCAFEILIKCAKENSNDELDYLSAISVIVSSAGVKGMIAGQAGDMEFEGSRQDRDVLEYIHEHKTAAMIKASVTSGAALMRATKEELNALNMYGGYIGLVFQIVDDILDETGDSKKIGKTPGKDSSANKQTFARFYGIDRSRIIARQKTDAAIKALAIFGQKAENLKCLAEYLLLREQ